MRQLAYDPQDLRPRQAPAHLYSPAGFLNDDWWHRTYWIFGTHFYSGYVGWYFAGHEAPAGRLLAIDDATIYGFGYKPGSYRGSNEQQNHLFAIDRRAIAPQPPADYRRANKDYPQRAARKFFVPREWTNDSPLLGRAMVLAGGTLFAAGPPSDALESRDAFEGVQGAQLCAVATADGHTLAEYQIDGLPVFDGLAAARRKLYMTLHDGRLMCLGDRQSTPGGAELPRAKTPGRAVAGVAVESGLAGHWSLDEGRGQVAADRSGLGNDGHVNGRWVLGGFGTCVFAGGTPAP